MVHDVHRRDVPPPAQHRGDEVVGDRQGHRGQGAEHLHPVRVQPGLLLGLADGRAHVGGADLAAGHGQHLVQVPVLGVQAPAREGDLPGVGAQRRGPLDQEDVEVPAHALRVLGGARGQVVERAEEDEHGRAAVVLVDLPDPPRLAVLHPQLPAAAGHAQQVLVGVAHGPSSSVVASSLVGAAHELRGQPSACSWARLRPARNSSSSSSRPGANSYLSRAAAWAVSVGPSP